MSERKFDNFDEFADDYRSIHSENIKATGADSSYFAEFKPIKLASIFAKSGFSPKVIADIGCGDGEVVKFLVKHFAGGNVSGIDISAESIEKAKNRGIDRTDFQVYDGITMPFVDNSVDLAVIANVLHHIEHGLHPQILAEVKRILKPGGVLAIFEHNPLNPITVKIVNDCVFDKDAVLMRNNHLTGILKGQHWQQISTRFLLFFPRSGFFKPFHALEPMLEGIPLGGQYLVMASK